MQEEEKSGQDDRKMPPSESATTTTSTNSSTGGLASCCKAATTSYQALKQLQDALQLIPEKEKAAYMEALAKAPRLVELESDPVRFLRCEDFNAWAAARRLANYWESRKSVFGDRAFLPLSQIGEGALSAEDLEVLNTGAMVLLPNDTKDRSVVFFDRSKLKPSMHYATGSRLRCAFYLLSIAAEQESAQTEGIVVLALVVKPPGTGYDWVFPQRIDDITSNALPIRVNGIHLLSLPSTSGRGKLMETVIKMCLKMAGTFFSKCAVHIGEAESDLLPKVKAAGLLKKDIPVELGGNWKLDKFELWKKRRIRAEQDLYLTEEQKLDRKRKINVVHSRQKRQRRKIEFQVVQEQVLRLSQQNAELYRQNKELNGFLEMAKREVARVEGGDETSPQVKPAGSDADNCKPQTALPLVVVPPSLTASQGSTLPHAAPVSATAVAAQATLPTLVAAADPTSQSLLVQMIAEQQEKELLQRKLMELLNPVPPNPQLFAMQALHPNNQIGSRTTPGMAGPLFGIYPMMVPVQVAYPVLPRTDESSCAPQGDREQPDASSAAQVVDEALARQQREMSLAAADQSTQQQMRVLRDPPSEPTLLGNLTNLSSSWLGSLTSGASNMFRSPAPGPIPKNDDEDTFSI